MQAEMVPGQDFLLVQLNTDKQQQRINKTAVHSVQITFPALLPFLLNTKVNKSL